jgi:hypothetical protein
MNLRPYEEMTVTQLVNKLPAFYGTKWFTACSQKPATGPYTDYLFSHFTK